MIIKTCVVGVVSTNCYLLINENTKETIIIDPGAEADKIILKIKELNVKPVAILLTHGHFDHVMAVKDLVEEYGIKTYGSKEEVAIFENDSLNCSGMIRQNYELEVDILLEDNEKVNLAGFDIEVIHTPGHTQGGVCYYIEDEGVLFSGDTLFADSIGRTDLPTGDIRALRNSIIKRLFVLPEEVEVYPGHGAKTTIGHEKAHNPFILE